MQIHNFIPSFCQVIMISACSVHIAAFMGHAVSWCSAALLLQHLLSFMQVPFHVMLLTAKAAEP